MPTPLPLLLLTRPDAQSQDFAAACAAQGVRAEVIVSPILRIEALAPPTPLPEMRAVILTSANAVRAIAPWRDWSGMQAFCVGERTADEARSAGFETVSSQGDAADLVDLIAGLRPNGLLFHPHGAHSRGDVAGVLTRKGLQVEAAIVYQQRPLALTAEALTGLASERKAILPLFSPRSARLVAQAAGPIRSDLAIVAISPAAAKGWSRPEGRMSIAERPDAQAMIAAIARIVDV